MAKQIVGVVADLTIIGKKNRSKRSDFKLNEEYFNYRKKGHYIRDCRSFFSNKRKSTKESKEKIKHARWQKNMAKVITGKSTPSNDNSNVKPYLANRAFMTCEVDEERE